jgi:hypothetical protein
MEGYDMTLKEEKQVTTEHSQPRQHMSTDALGQDKVRK